MAERSDEQAKLTFTDYNQAAQDAVSTLDHDRDEPSRCARHKGIEQVKSDGWHDEQIHGGNLRHVIAYKGTPTLTGRARHGATAPTSRAG